MTRRAVIACDSFKGSLSARQAADCIASALHEACPDISVAALAISDGGEGFCDAMKSNLIGKDIFCKVHDPIGRPMTARYFIDENGTAYIETAAASGLTLLTAAARNPLRTSTYGTGELLADAIRQGCLKIVLGLGGSATCDGGMGALSALGFKFYQNDGAELNPCGKSLSKVASIDDTAVIPRLYSVKIELACDVDNPFYGPSGAAHVFAPQKGATPEQVMTLDEGLCSFASVIEGYNGFNLHCSRVESGYLHGAGAAGGLAGGLASLAGAHMRSGIELVLDAVHFEELIEDCDVLITGEGRMDRQTLMGKAPFGVLQRARKRLPCLPVIGICGCADNTEALISAGFSAVAPTKPDCIPLEIAMQPDTACRYIRHAIIKLFESKIINFI